MIFRPYDAPSLAIGMLLCLPLKNAAGAGELPAVRITQTSESDGGLLPRPIVGVASGNAASVPFQVTVTWRCPAGTKRQQLFVTAADAWRIDDVREVPSPQTLQLDVPLRQMQWLTQTESACGNLADQRPPDETDASGIHYFRLAPGAAAYATVSCAPESGKPTMATSSTPLDVWLSCPADASDQTSP